MYHSLCDNCEKTYKLNFYVCIKCANKFNITSSVLNAFTKLGKTIVSQISQVLRPLDFRLILCFCFGVLLLHIKSELSFF